MPGKLKSRAISTAVSPKSKSKKESKKPKAGKVAEKVSESASEDEDEEDWEDEEDDEDEDDGVDEEGMKKLMKALGEGGLDDVGQMQLDALEGEDGESDEAGSEDADEDEEGPEEDEKGDEVSTVKKGKTPISAEAEDSDEDEEEEDQIALEDAESVDEDAVPHQKITLDNKVALERIRDTIALDSSLPWTETLSVTYPETIEVDVNDDLNRELAFYKQALHGANAARALAAKHSLPFTRPADYFAEMVKSDAHMERIRQRLLDEGASIKKSEDKRREREGKKFGKQVQIEKLKEREKSKKDMEERLKGLKRKNKDVLTEVQGAKDEDAFDVAVEDAISARPSKRSRSDSGPDAKNKISRRGRDAKFGFGGKGRRDKQNTRESTEDFGNGGGRGGRGGSGGRGRGRGGARGGGGGRGGGRGGSGGRGGGKRLGKSRRISSRGQ